MRKLLLVCLTVLAVNSRAQQNNIPVNDTLRYFQYKQLYKLPLTTSATAHPCFKSVAPIQNSGAITHVGSIFKNKDAALKVYGLEARALTPNIVVSGLSVGGVPMRLYLCNVVNGLPVLPALDSLSVGVPSVQPIQYGIRVGGTFTNSPVTVSGDFAVLARCVSQLDGDTVNIFRTSGHTGTSTSAPSPAHKFGEGLGVIRSNGVFYKTTNFNHPAFGAGTDYEFCVAPMVSFTLQVSQVRSLTMDGACANEVFTNINTSSPEFTNRQFNFNEFYRSLKPFDPLSAIVNGFVPDSSLSWDLGNGSPVYYLPPGKDTINLAFVAGSCNNFFTDSLNGKYKQSAYSVNAQTIRTMVTGTVACVWCGYDTVWDVSIREREITNSLIAYPNPTNGRMIISGLSGSNTVEVYNTLGEEIQRILATKSSAPIDLSQYQHGIYFIRVTSSENKTRTIKVRKE